MSNLNPKPSVGSSASVSPSLRHTAKEWDEIRKVFCSSIMADTSLNSLAQNLEGQDWPLRGPSEVPSAYFNLSFNELREQLALRGQPPSVADQLIDILKETLAFDNPFGEMVSQSQASAAEDNQLVKNLAKLKIDPDFPVSMTAFSAETLLVCDLEHINTLGEFALAAQRMATSVIVGGDFRALLNALSNIDERTLARYLPFRVGSTGLHYIEGLGQSVGAQPPAVQAALARRFKVPQSEADEALARSASSTAIEETMRTLQARAAALRGFCKDEYTDIESQIAAGASARRLVVILGDPVREAVVADMLPRPPAPTKPVGFFARLLNRIKG
ncbi:MAG: hypothetical protein WC205_13785 [Opitutaceae bacterium]|jgi:hypothetical protein